MQKLALATAVVLAMLGSGAESAQAGCGYGYSGRFSGGYFGGSAYAGYGPYSPYFNRPGPYYYGHVHHGVNPNTAALGGGSILWHDTSHYDYVPGNFVRHGNHFHYQPGGYIWHQDGHFDLQH